MEHKPYVCKCGIFSKKLVAIKTVVGFSHLSWLFILFLFSTYSWSNTKTASPLTHRLLPDGRCSSFNSWSQSSNQGISWSLIIKLCLIAILLFSKTILSPLEKHLYNKYENLCWHICSIFWKWYSRRVCTTLRCARLDHWTIKKKKILHYTSITNEIYNRTCVQSSSSS